MRYFIIILLISFQACAEEDAYQIYKKYAGEYDSSWEICQAQEECLVVYADDMCHGRFYAINKKHLTEYQQFNQKNLQAFEKVKNMNYYCKPGGVNKDMINAYSTSCEQGKCILNY